MLFSGLFVSLYAAVERLLLYQDQSNPAYSSKAACRCILLHEFCPALHTILEDGLKVILLKSQSRNYKQICQHFKFLA